MADEEMMDDEPKKGRPSNAAKLAEVHAEALEEFDAIQSALRDERLQCLQDRRFYTIAGAQWEGPLGDQFVNKPMLEVNKIEKSVNRIEGEYRNNRMDVEFITKDGSDADDLADTCAALHRADEQDSKAKEAYDNAFQEGLGGGIGAWRLRAKYEDDEWEDEDGRQRIQIEPITDADSSVFFDLDAKLQDKSDARCCFVLVSMTLAEYRRKYNDDPTTWPKIVMQSEFDWLTPEVVYLAEYYKVEVTKEVVHFYRSKLSGDEVQYTQADLDADEDLERTLMATGYEKIEERKRKRRRVHKYLMNGREVLEDCKYIAGPNIPIVVFYAKRWFIDNVERCKGHVRGAKDPQRLKNMQISKLAELSAYSSVEKPIMSPEEIEGHEQMWSKDNVVSWPYLLKNQILDSAGNPINVQLQYTKAPQLPQAMAALLQLTESDMDQILGNPQQSEKVVSHVAGKTMELVQMRIDEHSVLYIDNMAKAIQRSGEIWLGMAAGREGLYTEEGRRMKGLDAQNQRRPIVLNQPIIDMKTKKITRMNDLTRAKFDVVVVVGPSARSKRQAAVNTSERLLGVVQDPESQMVLSHVVLMNMEGEGIEPIRKWSHRKLAKAGVVPPTPEEAELFAAEAKAAQQPTPQDQYLLSNAEKAKADAQKAVADTALKAAQVDKTKADTVKVLADVGREHVEASANMVEQLHGMVTTPPPVPPGQSSPQGGGLGSES